MKKIGIMQPYLFPYIGYFQLIKAADQYVVYDDVQFIKGGWINRNNILINGRKALLTFPLSGASANKKINEIKILKMGLQKNLKTISMAYSKAPYRNETIKLLDKIFSSNEDNLAIFIGESIKQICKYLGITTDICYSSELHKDNSLKAEEKVVAICKELGAGMYINAIGGQSLYDKEAFKKVGINLNFLKTLSFEYKQFNQPFTPNLSIIDVMMFNSPEEVNVMLDNYEFV